MRRPIATILLGLVLAVTAACGQEGPDGRAGEPNGPGSTESSSPTQSSGSGTTGPVTVAEVTILSQSDAGGSVDTRPVVLADEHGVDRSALGRFAAPLGRGLDDRVREAVRATDVPAGGRLLGAVVAIGCEVATGVEVTREDGDLVVQGEVPKSNVQCLVPVTSVALVVVR